MTATDTARDELRPTRPKGEVELEVDDVHAYYGDSHVLHGASLTVPRGAVVGLLGRNGMGKTTLVKSITGLLPTRGGRILFRGEEIHALAPHLIARRGIALVPQGRRNFGSLRVRENLELPRSRFTRRPREVGPDDWTVERVFAQFPHLDRRQNARAETLSGGEAQMLTIGRALMANPALLVMDEPSEGLAPSVIDMVREVLLGLKQRDLSVLLVEQNFDLAMSVCDHIHVLSEGTVVHSSTVEEFAERRDVQDQHLGLHG
jgi:branched-chain amino acid transport system ATP-binding protein